MKTDDTYTFSEAITLANLFMGKAFRGAKDGNGNYAGRASAWFIKAEYAREHGTVRAESYYRPNYLIQPEPEPVKPVTLKRKRNLNCNLRPSQKRYLAARAAQMNEHGYSCTSEDIAAAAAVGFTLAVPNWGNSGKRMPAAATYQTVLKVWFS